MKIAIGCDHIVTNIKNELIEMLKEDGITVVDCGTYDQVRTHYPIFGQKVAIEVMKKNVDFGIVICGTGVGITNAAQKIKGSRVALVRDVITAKEARQSYDANIIGFGGRITGLGLIYEITKAFINTKYLGHNNEEIKEINSQISNENYDASLLDKEIKKWDEGFYN